MSLIRPTGTGLVRPTGTGLIRPANVGLVRTSSGGSVASAYAAAVLADAPKAYFKLDETSGTTLTDSSTVASNGTYPTAPTVGVAPLITSGRAATFAAASSQYGNVPSNAAYAATTAITLEAWIKTTQAGAGNPIVLGCQAAASPNNRWQFRLSTTGTLEFILFDNADNPHTATGAVTINDGVTHHIVGVYNGATMLVYVDGAVDGAGTAVVMTLAAGFPAWQIACRTTSGSQTNFLTGTVDEVALYVAALSPTRIDAHNTAGRT